MKVRLPNLAEAKLLALGGSLALFSFAPSTAQSDMDLRHLHLFDPYAAWAPSPNFDYRPSSREVDTIVLHHTACTLEETIRHFSKPHTKVSAHFTIDKTGDLIQHTTTLHRAWHAGPSLDPDGREKVNDFSIGIELVHQGTTADSYPDAQIQSLIALIKRLQTQTTIKRIVSHRSIAQPPGRKKDPIAFPWHSLDVLNVELCP